MNSEQKKQHDVAIGIWPPEYRYKLGVIVSHKSLINGTRYTAKKFMCESVDREWEKMSNDKGSE